MNVELILREMTTDAQVQALESGALDIGFVLPPVDRPGLSRRVMATGNVPAAA